MLKNQIQASQKELAELSNDNLNIISQMNSNKIRGSSQIQKKRKAKFISSKLRNWRKNVSSKQRRLSNKRNKFQF